MKLLTLFLLLFGILQGIIVGLFILHKKSRQVSSTLFILFLIVVGLQLIFKVVSKIWFWHNLSLLYQFSYSLPYLIGPVVYFLVRSKNQDSFALLDMVHFTPFLISILYTLAQALGYHFVFPFYWQPGLQLVLLLSYGMASWRLLFSGEEDSTRKSLKQFIILVILAEAIIIITISLIIRYDESFPDVRLLFAALTLLIYWISYKLMLDPGLFLSVHEKASILSLKRSENVAKYLNSGLKPDDAERIATLLHEAIHNQKIFLQKDVTIQALAVKLDVSKNHLSRVINERFHKNFVDFANGWRLDESRSRLADPKFHKYTISTIALSSGFSSVSSFNTMFKRHFQITPSEFRKQRLKEAGL